MRTVALGSAAGLLLAALGFAVESLVSPVPANPGAAASPVVIESVEQVEAPSTPEPAAVPAQPASSEVAPSPPPLPPPQPATVPRAAPAPVPVKPAAPATVAATTPPKQAPAPVAASSSTPRKDKWDERLEMFEEAAKMRGNPSSDDSKGTPP